MREQTKKFIAYLNLLGVKIDSRSFADRIKAQKLAYILQKLTGKQLYDDFNFYVRGPYSHELAVEYFNSGSIKSFFVASSLYFLPFSLSYFSMSFPISILVLSLSIISLQFHQSMKNHKILSRLRLYINQLSRCLIRHRLCSLDRKDANQIFYYRMSHQNT